MALVAVAVKFTMPLPSVDGVAETDKFEGATCVLPPVDPPLLQPYNKMNSKKIIND